MKLIRRGFQRLGEEKQLVGENRQLALLRVLQLAFDTDQIAQIEALRQRPVLLPDLLLADIELNLSGPIADVGEDELARVAHEHDAAASTDSRAMLLAVPLPGGRRVSDNFAFAAADFADGLVVVEAAAPGIKAQGLDFSEFFPPRGFQRLARSFRLIAGIRGHDERHAICLTPRIATF